MLMLLRLTHNSLSDQAVQICTCYTLERRTVAALLTLSMHAQRVTVSVCLSVCVYHCYVSALKVSTLAFFIIPVQIIHLYMDIPSSSTHTFQSTSGILAVNTHKPSSPLHFRNAIGSQDAQGID